MEGDIIPASVAATPTAPDMDPFFEAHLGNKVAATGHTITGIGSTGTSLVLGGGGGATSGIPTTGGVLIAVDVDAANGIEVRFVVSRATDTVTLDRALSANPASDTATSMCPVQRTEFSVSALKTLHLWGYLDGDNFRQKAGGCVPRQMQLACDFTPETPVGTCTFSGEGTDRAAHRGQAHPGHGWPAARADGIEDLDRRHEALRHQSGAEQRQRHRAARDRVVLPVPERREAHGQQQPLQRVADDLDPAADGHHRGLLRQRGTR